MRILCIFADACIYDLLLNDCATPARECHLVRNWFNPILSPWFKMDKDASIVQLSPFTYKANELRKW